MKVYVDNDIIHKLAAFNLFDAALETLGVKASDVVVLATAKFKFFVAKQQDKGEKRYGAELHARIGSIIAGAAELTDDPPPEHLHRLQNIIGIDPGEAVLLAAAAADDGALLLTGDKKCLRAFAEAGIDDMAASLSGRVLCLEQVLQRLISARTFEEVRDAVAPARDVDLAMKAVFSAGAMSLQANVDDGLRSYVDHLRGETGSLLAREE